MIRFVCKQFTEYDAMRALFVQLQQWGSHGKFQVINRSELIPVLRGNNIVIERFVLVHRNYGQDVYRMYLKIGAKAKLPDDVRLTGGKVYDQQLLNLGVSFDAKPAVFDYQDRQYQNQQTNNQGQNNQKKQKKYSFYEERMFKGDGPKPSLGSNYTAKLPYFNLTRTVHELLGEALEYDKEDRSLVLEFKSIEDSIRALNILPFGLSYKIYLLDA